RTIVRASVAGEWEPQFEFFEQHYDHPERKWLDFTYETLSPPDSVANFFKKQFSGARTHWEEIGEGPGSYILLLVEALSARIHITWENDRGAVTLEVNLDEDRAPELASFLANACKDLAMVRRK